MAGEGRPFTPLLHYCVNGLDLLVEHIVLVELNVAKAIDDIHLAQCLNYLEPQACISACCSTSASLAGRQDCQLTSTRRGPSVCIGGSVILRCFSAGVATKGNLTTDIHRWSRWAPVRNLWSVI
jgi:hypothetical protein